MRGAGAWEGDAHQTLFVVREHEQRFIVLGKRRFEAQWQELAVETNSADVVTTDERRHGGRGYRPRAFPPTFSLGMNGNRERTAASRGPLCPAWRNSHLFCGRRRPTNQCRMLFGGEIYQE